MKGAVAVRLYVSFFGICVSGELPEGKKQNFLISERIKSTTYHRQPGNRYFLRTYTGAELDYVEERGGQLYGFEFKWGEKTAKAPKSWLENYPEANFRLINRENYLNFLQVRD